MRSCVFVFLVGVVSFFSRIWFCSVRAVFWLCNALRKKRHVSHVKNEILLLSGIELAVKIRNQEITSVEVVESFIDRIRLVNPLINCMVEDNFDKARSQARAIDLSILNESAPSKNVAPFLGVPFTSKDCISVKGKLCTAGVPKRKNLQMTVDAEVIRNMQNAGAIYLAVTNVSEVCMWWEASNTIYGRSKNPYDVRVHIEA